MESLEELNTRPIKNLLMETTHDTQDTAAGRRIQHEDVFSLIRGMRVPGGRPQPDPPGHCQEVDFSGRLLKWEWFGKDRSDHILYASSCGCCYWVSVRGKIISRRSSHRQVYSANIRDLVKQIRISGSPKRDRVVNREGNKSVLKDAYPTDRQGFVSKGWSLEFTPWVKQWQSTRFQISP